jgi:hypothetical protein
MDSSCDSKDNEVEVDNGGDKEVEDGGNAFCRVLLVFVILEGIANDGDGTVVLCKTVVSLEEGDDVPLSLPP